MRGPLHREVARAAVARSQLEVWVNNAGVLRTRKAWDHDDDEVRLLVDVNLMGVIWGTRAAITAKNEARRPNLHVINSASLSALAPRCRGWPSTSTTKHAGARVHRPRCRAI